MVRSTAFRILVALTWSAVPRTFQCPFLSLRFPPCRPIINQPTADISATFPCRFSEYGVSCRVHATKRTPGSSAIRVKVAATKVTLTYSPTELKTLTKPAGRASNLADFSKYALAERHDHWLQPDKCWLLRTVCSEPESSVSFRKCTRPMQRPVLVDSRPTVRDPPVDAPH
jgi:hypothetical protein